MFFKAETVYFAFFNFSTLLTWIFPACETESEHNESKSAQIGKFHCLGSKISMEILVVDCILTTKHVPMVAKTVQELQFRRVFGAFGQLFLTLASMVLTDFWRWRQPPGGQWF